MGEKFEFGGGVEVVEFRCTGGKAIMYQLI